MLCKGVGGKAGNTRKEGDLKGGRFVVNSDKTISPTMATHLVLGAIRKGEDVEAAVTSAGGSHLQQSGGGGGGGGGRVIHRKPGKRVASYAASEAYAGTNGTSRRA